MDIFHFRHQRRGRRLKRMIVFAVVAAVVIVVLLVASFAFVPGVSTRKAEADSADAYPASCLGGWQGPANAEGAPDAGVGLAAVFTADNSAVLQNADAQIFCGSFAASDQSQTPTAVILHFSWNVTFPGNGGGSAAPTGTDSANWSSVLDTTSTATSTSASTTTATTTTTAPAPTVTATTTTTTTTATTPAAATSTASTPAAPATPTPSAATSSSPSQDSTQTTTPTSTPAPAPVPAQASTSPSTPAPTDSSGGGTSVPASTSTSFLGAFMKDPVAFLVGSKALADTTDTATQISGNAFLDVSYSLDGTTWQDLGEVSADNWQNFSAAIPISSWSDVNAIQVKLTPALSADPPSAIYLDGMWLEVDYASSGNILQQGASAALGAVSDLGSAVTDAITSILPGGDNASGTQAQAQPQQPQATTPPPPPPAVHKYSFQAMGGIAASSKDLSWVPASDLKEYNASATASTQGSMPTVTVVGSNSIRVAGTCSEDYYTILLFANQDDYRSNPAAALYNSAAPCVGGNFVRTIADTEFPPQLSSGTYYLIVANQGKKGPWQPFPQIYPIQLGNGAGTSH